MAKTLEEYAVEKIETQEREIDELRKQVESQGRKIESLSTIIAMFQKLKPLFKLKRENFIVLPTIVAHFEEPEIFELIVTLFQLKPEEEENNEEEVKEDATI